jgi:aryl-alcohol dehydrogenase-like predicted oxidoreductase
VTVPPTPVQDVRLGRSEVKVTRLMLGTAPIGGLYAPVPAADAQATFDAAWQAGIRAFDTAPHYGVGLAEQRLGEFLAAKPRAEYVVSTKVGRRLLPSDGPVDGVDEFFGTPQLTRVWDFSRDGAVRSIEESMSRLGLDRIDIALIHDPDDHAAQALEGAYRALHQLRSEGMIGAIGVGMNQPELPAWFIARADLDCVLIAGRYSLLNTSAATKLLPECERRGVGVLAGGVFNSGILADPRPGARYDYQPAPPSVVERAQRIRAACASHGLPIGAVALAFTLRHRAVTAAVIGARTADEITQDVGYLTLDVPESLFAEIGAL